MSRRPAAQCARCGYTSRPCRCEMWMAQEQARRRDQAIERQNAAQQAVLQIARARPLQPVSAPLAAPPAAPIPLFHIPRASPPGDPRSVGVVSPLPAATPIPGSWGGLVPPPLHSHWPFGVRDQAPSTSQRGSMQFRDASSLGGQSGSMQFFNPASQGHQSWPPTSAFDPILGPFDLSNFPSFHDLPSPDGQSVSTSQGHQSMPSSAPTSDFDPLGLFDPAYFSSDPLGLHDLSSMLAPSSSIDSTSWSRIQTVPATASLGQLHASTSGLAPPSSMGQPGATSTSVLDPSPSSQAGLGSYIDRILPGQYDPTPDPSSSDPPGSYIDRILPGQYDPTPDPSSSDPPGSYIDRILPGQYDPTPDPSSSDPTGSYIDRILPGQYDPTPDPSSPSGQLHASTSGLAPPVGQSESTPTSVIDPSSSGPSGSYIDRFLPGQYDPTPDPSSSPGQPTPTPNPVAVAQLPVVVPAHGPDSQVGQHGSMPPVNSPISDEEVQSAAPRENPDDDNND